MKKLAPAFVLILFAACASSQAAKDAADDVPTPPPPGPTVEQRLTDMQTSMTEMLERLDVLSDRIARMEAETPVGGQAPSPVQSAPAPGQARAPVPTPQQQQQEAPAV